MTSPLGAPFHVDVVRFGGSQATQRHAFGTPGNGVSPQAPPPSPAAPARISVAPPPTRIYLGDRPLGQGQPTTPRIPPEALPELQSAIGHAVETLRYELETVKAEAQTVAPQAVRSNPDAFRSIESIGQYLTPQEIRSAMILAAKDLSQQAQRLLTGAASPYVSADQRSVLNTVVSDAAALVKFLQQFDLTPLGGANLKLAEDYAGSHTADVSNVIDAVEREVVSHESASVPVVEPGESALGGPGALLALGALVAVTVILMETL